MWAELIGFDRVGTQPDLHGSITARQGNMGTIRRPSYVVHLLNVIGVEQASSAGIPHLYQAAGSGKSQACIIR